MLQKTLFLMASAVFFVSSSLAQQPTYVRDFCVKVKPGKGADYAKRLQEVSAKLARVRVDEGRAIWWAAQRAIVPVGSEARCDYHILYASTGFPPERLSREQISADLKKAGVGMSYEEMVGQRNELSTLVSLDIWRLVGGVGAGVKGSYVRHNLYKAKPGQTNEWVRLETESWMPVAKTYADEGSGRGWVAAVRAIPQGDDLKYNAITVDIFPTWAALGEGIGALERWKKVHPNLDVADYLGLLDNVRTVHRRQVFQIAELIAAE